MSPGRHFWAVAGGCIPLRSSGPEPEFVSQDRVSILNAGERKAEVALTIYYENREPAGPYRLVIKARRTRSFRIGDLIEPEAVPLGVPYALLLSSEEPVVVQFGRLDSGARAAAHILANAFGHG